VIVFQTASCGLHGSQRGAQGLLAPDKPSEQILAKASKSVCLIKGSYVFRGVDDGKVLRRSGWFLNGDESVLVKTYSGTGFLVSSGGDIVTNRHIAQPWWADSEAQKIASAGYRAELTSLSAYFPGLQTTYPLKTVRVSVDADVALLCAESAENLPAPLRLVSGERVAPGDRIMLVGYPGGLGSILGRDGQTRLDGLPGSLNFTEDQTAQALAAQGLIEPFVSFGHVSNVGALLLTLSAQTSDGSSGSPVLDENGAIIAVHSASLTQVNGASLAVPAEAVRKLIYLRQGG
jgi:S1-C subfamily serine protease